MIAALAGIQLIAMLSAGFTPAPFQDTLSLSLAEAREMARSQAPRALAAEARLDAARGAARTAATYPYNPRAEVKTPELFSTGSRGHYEAIFSQELEWAGQIGLRRSIGRSSDAAAAADHSDEMRLFFADVDGAYHSVVAASEKAAVYQEGARLTRALRDAVAVQLREGQVSALEANLAEIQAARSEAAMLAVRAEVASASAALARILGLEPTTPIRADALASPSSPPPLEALDALLAEAAQRRPDLRASEARLEEAERVSSLAGRRVIPNLGLAAVVSRAGQLSPTEFGLRVSLGFPLWDRNQGPRQQGTALVRLQTHERRDAELRVSAEVSVAWERVRSARESMTLYETRVLGQARANRGLLERARAEGRIDLPTMLVLQSQLIEAEVAYWDVWREARLAETALEVAVGRIS